MKKFVKLLNLNESFKNGNNTEALKQVVRYTSTLFDTNETVLNKLKELHTDLPDWYYANVLYNYLIGKTANIENYYPLFKPNGLMHSLNNLIQKYLQYPNPKLTDDTLKVIKLLKKLMDGHYISHNDIKCTFCNGTGMAIKSYDVKCPICNGTGKVNYPTLIDINSGYSMFRKFRAKFSANAAFFNRFLNDIANHIVFQELYIDWGCTRCAKYNTGINIMYNTFEYPFECDLYTKFDEEYFNVSFKHLGRDYIFKLHNLNYKPEGKRSNEKRSNEKRSNEKRSNEKRSNGKRSDGKRSNEKSSDGKSSDGEVQTICKYTNLKGKSIIGYSYNNAADIFKLSRYYKATYKNVTLYYSGYYTRDEVRYAFSKCVKATKSNIKVRTITKG